MAANVSGRGQTELVMYRPVLSKRRTKAFVSTDKLNTVIIITTLPLKECRTKKGKETWINRKYKTT